MFTCKRVVSNCRNFNFTGSKCNAVHIMRGKRISLSIYLSVYVSLFITTFDKLCKALAPFYAWSVSFTVGKLSFSIVLSVSCR